ncbi:hypothetical protein Tco_0917608, partial [Tanacetum coccineum]
MTSESTSSQQSQQLIPSSKVNFRCIDSIISFNNAVALLEYSKESFRPMFSFLLNFCINRAPYPSTHHMYVEYLRGFIYNKGDKREDQGHYLLTFGWDKPLSFTQDEFVSAIGLTICKDIVPLPPTETVRARLETLDYVSNDLTLVKPHTITTASFQKPLASEVPLTSRMLKVAKLSKEPEQSLLLPSGEIKKKKIPPSSKPKSPYKVRVILLKKQVTEIQHTEVTVATVDATKSLEAFKLAEEQGNQPSAAKAVKITVLDQNVEEEEDVEFVAMEEVAEEQSLEFPTVKQLLDEADKLNKAVQETPKSPYDTELEIKV